MVESDEALCVCGKVGGLAYRAACRHARRSTAKPRDAVHAPHGQAGGWARRAAYLPTGASWGRGRPRTPLCRRLTRLEPSLRSESLPNGQKCSFCRFSSVENRFSKLARARFGPIAALFQPFQPRIAAKRAKRRCIFAYSNYSDYIKS